MKKLLLCLISVIGLGLLVVGCAGANAGPETQRSFNFTDFNKVEISSAFQVDLVPSDSYCISITAQEKLFDHIKVSKSGDTLQISMQWSFGTWLSSWGYHRPKARITMPTLAELHMSGASKGTAKGFKSPNDITITVSGASSLDIDIEANASSIEVSGASHTKGMLKSGDAGITVNGASSIDLTGSGNNLDINVSGASRAILEGYSVRNANVTVSGASRATVTVDSKMTVELSGASSLDYSGNPTLDVKDISGASTIHKK